MTKLDKLHQILGPINKEEMTTLLDSTPDLHIQEFVA